MSESEEWRDIADTNGKMQVSDWGRVRYASTGVLLEPKEVAGGYLSVSGVVNGREWKRRVHTLVLEAFVGPAPNGEWAEFGDDDRHNCALANLSWGDPRWEGGGDKTQVGDVAGDFEAVADVGTPTGSHVKHWQVRCTRCDGEYVVQGQHFREGRCKCDRCDHVLFPEPTTERDIDSKARNEIREYKKWLDMKNRCKNRPHYREAGIAVCVQWQNDFVQFFRDVGPQPGPDHSLDRWPDPAGNYEPDNVRWATPRQQNENRCWAQKPLPAPKP